MLDSARNRVEAVPRVPAHLMLSVGALASCSWLLIQGQVHPFAIYLLQVYLTF